MDTIFAGGVAPVYVSETGTRDEILPVVYLSETVVTGDTLMGQMVL